MRIIIDIKALPGLLDGERNLDRRRRLQGHIATHVQDFLDEWLGNVEVEDVTVET